MVSSSVRSEPARAYSLGPMSATSTLGREAERAPTLRKLEERERDAAAERGLAAARR
jgi:hypothetical protein